MHCFIAVHIASQLLSERRCICCENSSESFASGEFEDFIFHEMHDGNVFDRIELGARCHHERVENLIGAEWQLVVTVSEISLVFIADGQIRFFGIKFTHRIGPSRNSRNSKTTMSFEFTCTAGSSCASKLSATPTLRPFLSLMMKLKSFSTKTSQMSCRMSA